MRCLYVPAALSLLLAACGETGTQSVGPVAPFISGPRGYNEVSSGSGWIRADKDDYVPGETVTILAGGWEPGETVVMTLTEEPDAQEDLVLTSVADAEGNFANSDFSVTDIHAGVVFTLSAEGQTSGMTASTMFNDGTLAMTAASPTPFSPNQASSAGVKDNIAIDVCNKGSATNNVKVRIRAGVASDSPGSQALIKEISVGNLPASSHPSLCDATGGVVWDGRNTANAFVADGIYTARVTDLPATGTENNGDERKRQIVVDNTNPTPAVDVIADGTNGVEMTITGTASDLPSVAGAGLEKVEITIRRTSNNAILASGLATNTGTNFSTWSFTYTPSEASAQKAIAKATDNAGNHASAERSFNVQNADDAPPDVNCSVPNQSIWYANDVTVNCTASDAGSGLANPDDDAAFSLSTNVAAGNETATAQTESRQVCDAATPANCTTVGPYTFKVDKKAPEVSCGSADTAWHADDVSISCTASDGGSGVSPSSDEGFSLSTDVPDGTETDNASTESKNVCDTVGNCATAGPIGGNMVDKKAPSVSCGSADGLWHASDVSIGCTASDGGSGLAIAGDASFSLSTSVTAGTETSDAETGSKNVCDDVGNCATAGPIGGNMIDKKGPVVTLSCPATPVILGTSASASWTAADGGSGVALGFGAGNIALDTSSVGAKTATVPAGTSKDKVDNQSPQASCGYSVIYDWDGFFSPVDNLPTWNVAKAGSAIPVKFSLAGDQGLNIFPAGYPKSQKVFCDTSVPVDAIEETVTAGGSSLSYDSLEDQYVYVWKSEKSWALTCRQLTVMLDDGTTHQANFNFKK